MSVVIKVSARDRAKAWGILVRHSAGTALPNRTFLISEEAAKALRKAGVKFTEVSREEAASTHGVAAGERI